MRITKSIEDGRLTVHLTHNEGEAEIVISPTSYGWFVGYAISVPDQELIADEGEFFSDERDLLLEWVEHQIAGIKMVLEEWA